MEKLQRALHGCCLLAALVSLTGATVAIPFSPELLYLDSELTSTCKVENETFIGWYNMTDNTKIPDKFIRIDRVNNDYSLYLPRGTTNYAGGKYKCQGQTNFAILSLEATCLDQIPTKKDFAFEAGGAEKIEIGCVSYPKTTFTWKKNGAAFNPNTGRFKQDKLGTVTFSSVQKDDEAVYELTSLWPAEEGSRKKISTFNVKVGKKPKFTKTPKTDKLSTAVGYNFTLCCKAEGDAPLTLSWLKTTSAGTSPVDISDKSKASITDDCLTVKKLQKPDSATYTCKAKNNLAEIQTSVVVNVLDPAKITSDLKDVQKKSGENFEVTCTARGSQPLTIVWKKGDEEVNPDSKSSTQSTLKFQGLKLEDTATYTCIAHNEATFKNKRITSEKSFKLSVLSKPVLNTQVSSPSTIYSFIGNSNAVNIRCHFYGYPVPAVAIKKDGKELAKGTSSAEFSLTTTKKEQFGNYACEATNSFGREKYVVQLKEAVAPGVPRDVSADKTCKDVTLKWNAPSSDGGMAIKKYLIKLEKDGKVLLDTDAGANKDSHKIAYKFERATAYKLSIKAKNLAGTGKQESLDVTTDKFCKPSPPKITSKALVIKGPKYRVTWDAPDDNGFDGELRYRVHWTKISSTPPGKVKRSSILDDMVYDIDDLDKGRYKLDVYAINRAGDSQPETRYFNVTEDLTSPPALPTVPDGLRGNGEPTTSPGAEPVEKNKGGLSKGVIAAIVIAIVLIVLLTIDLLCCFFNSCGLIFCCTKACCGDKKGKYEPETKDKKTAAEMEKLKGEPEPVNV